MLLSLLLVWLELWGMLCDPRHGLMNQLSLFLKRGVLGPERFNPRQKFGILFRDRFILPRMKVFCVLVNLSSRFFPRSLHFLDPRRKLT